MNITSYYKILWIFSLMSSAYAQYTDQAGVRIRVLIDSIALEKPTPAVFSSRSALTLACEKDPNKKYVFQTRIVMEPHEQKIRVNKKEFPMQIMRLTSADGRITYNGKTYMGAFYCQPTNSSLDIINKVPLEDYITSVVRTEAWPSWPLEAFKVQAIASRTYVIYHMQHAQRQKKHYHVVASNLHQTYCGVHECQLIKDAVKETEGIFIAYKNQPILAMYDACCGGVVPAHDTRGIANATLAPYLARTSACTFCRDFKIYSWTRKISTQAIIQRLQGLFPTLKHIISIDRTVDAAGIVQEVIVRDKERSYKIAGSKFRVLFSEIPSLVFTLKKRASMVTIKGHGYGHHMGLCQWGAYELVRRGWNYQRILHFYYPGVTLMKLCYRQKQPTA